MMIGIAKGSLPGADKLGPAEALTAAAGLGMDGILFHSIVELSPTLDPHRLSALKAQADGLGVELHTGCGWISPGHPERGADIAALAGGDFVAGLAKAAHAAAAIGIRTLFFVIGTIDERDDASRPWKSELQAVIDTIGRAAPALRDVGVRLLVKTHEEITTQEIIRLVEAVGDDVLGVSLDPVNVLCRLEDPIDATRRVAPYVKLIHIEDAIVQFEGDGIRRFLAPLGKGVIDWPATFALCPGVPAFLELHKGQFAMPVFDRAWLAAQPDLDLGEYASVLGMAHRDKTGAMPWDQADPISRLEAGRRFLREMT